MVIRAVLGQRALTLPTAPPPASLPDEGEPALITAAPRPQWHRPIRGEVGAPCVVVCEPQSHEAAKHALPTSMENLSLFAKLARKFGMTREDFVFVSLCPPLPNDALGSKARAWAHVQQYVPGLLDLLGEWKPRCIVPMGEHAARSVLGRSVAITKARGIPVQHQGATVFPLLAAGFVHRIPEHMPTFEADLSTLSNLKENGWVDLAARESDRQYEWCEDLSALIANPPALLSVDTETTGLDHRAPGFRVITVQLSYREGHALVCPIHEGYWPAWQVDPAGLVRLRGQLEQLLTDPSIKKLAHNMKYDDGALRAEGITVEGWHDDTQMMAFGVDENMMQKSLDECVRRWVPAMAGYADEFNQTVDKSRMLEVPHDKMLGYAGGDTDAALRLFNVLDPMLRADQRQYNAYRRIHIPALLTFGRIIEQWGMLVDRDRLREFGVEVSAFLASEYRELIRSVPVAVRRKHLAMGKELKFSRPEFMKDILFSPQGFNLTPVVFTKTTKDLEDPSKREPSTSTKDHLPFFFDRGDAAGDFCVRIAEYQKAEKLRGTYIGEDSEVRDHRTGLWQYISPAGRIHPSYKLHATVTGRTASDNPNGQNFPKRGRFAKPYQKIFLPSPGFKLVNCDLSQIELRLAAWMAMDPTMLEVYRTGGDIHTTTAMATMGVTPEQWAQLSKAERKLARTKAKAVNFGFVYGMGWRGFRTYAKTQYGVDYTEKEAEQTRVRFFQTYSKLPAWHESMKEQAHRYGHVRALHGTARHLPSIKSRDSGIAAMSERQAINSPVQRLGSDLGLIAMTRFSRQADPNIHRIIGFVHDALVLEVRDGYEQEGIEALLYAMEDVTPLRQWFGITPPLPIKAEADIGLNGGEMLEFAELPDPDKRPEWFNALGFDTVQARKPCWWDDAREAAWEAEVQQSLADSRGHNGGPAFDEEELAY